MQRIGLLVVACITWGVLTVSAQDETCNIKKYSLEDDTCNNLNTGEACLVTDGEVIELEARSVLETGEGEIVIAQIPGEDIDSTIRLTLYGTARLESAIQSANEPITATNSVGYTVNLRAQPSTIYSVVSGFPANASYPADGRNANGDWLRLQTENGIAWVFADLVETDGDANTLPILDTAYTEPLQAMTLATEQSGCASSGLMIEYNGANETRLQINDTDIAMSAGTLIVTNNEDTLAIRSINSNISVTTNSETATPPRGGTVTIQDGGIQSEERFSFAAIQGAPLELATQTVCIVGTTDETISSYTQPTSDAQQGISIAPEGHYQVVSYQEDEEGQRWWQIQEDNQSAWVNSEEVQNRGLCENVLQFEASAPIAENANSAPQPNNTQNSQYQAMVENILNSQSIWSANSGEENRTGNCTFPPVAMCQHLVAISQNPDGSISWRGQEPTPYTLYPSEDGQFFGYQGRNKRNNANLGLSLTFQSESRWTMTMTTVFDNDPECIRTFYYTATRNR